MGSRDPRVDAYIGKAAPFARPVLKHLRKIVHAGCPGVEETIKWSFPHFTYNGSLCAMAAFKQHCTFALRTGSLLKDEGLAISRDAMGQFGRITSLSDLPPERRLVRLIRKAAALNEQGAPARRPARARPRTPLAKPAFFRAALRNNRKALAAYRAFSPSHKRDYIEWVTEARRDDTRQRRLATALEWMAVGKARNWKYMNR